ncbi:hypothetical protein HK100_007531, partial [Physocladia obscura]
MVECPVCAAQFATIAQLQDKHIDACLGISTGNNDASINTSDYLACPICGCQLDAYDQNYANSHVNACLERTVKSHAKPPKTTQSTLVFGGAKQSSCKSKQCDRSSDKLSFEVLSSDDEFRAVKKHVRIPKSLSTVPPHANSKKPSKSSTLSTNTVSKKKKKSAQHENTKSDIFVGVELDSHLSSQYQKILDDVKSKSSYFAESFIDEGVSEDWKQSENDNNFLHEDGNEDDGSVDMWELSSVKLDSLDAEKAFKTRFLSQWTDACVFGEGENFCENKSEDSKNDVNKKIRNNAISSSRHISEATTKMQSKNEPPIIPSCSKTQHLTEPVLQGSTKKYTTLIEISDDSDEEIEKVDIFSKLQSTPPRVKSPPQIESSLVQPDSSQMSSVFEKLKIKDSSPNYSLSSKSNLSIEYTDTTTILVEATPQQPLKFSKNNLIRTEEPFWTVENTPLNLQQFSSKQVTPERKAQQATFSASDSSPEVIILSPLLSRQPFQNTRDNNDSSPEIASWTMSNPLEIREKFYSFADNINISPSSSEIICFRPSTTENEMIQSNIADMHNRQHESYENQFDFDNDQCDDNDYFEGNDEFVMSYSPPQIQPIDDRNFDDFDTLLRPISSVKSLVSVAKGKEKFSGSCATAVSDFKGQEENESLIEPKTRRKKNAINKNSVSEQQKLTKPDYSSMKIQELEKIAGSYGIRKLPKPILVGQLSKIWDQLHHSIPTETVELAATTLVSPAISQETLTAPSKPKTARKRKICAETDPGTPNLSVEQKIYEYIKSNTELYSKILRYQPLELENVLVQMKTAGMKCNKK